MTEMTGKVHAVVMWLDYTMATEVDEAMKGAIVRLPGNSGGASLMPLLRQHAL